MQLFQKDKKVGAMVLIKKTLPLRQRLETFLVVTVCGGEMLLAS